MPAVTLSFTSEISEDSSTLTITDTTANGVGTNGYGQTGGLAVADVTDAELIAIFTFSDASTETHTVALFPSDFNAAPFIEGEVYILDMSSFGGLDTDKFRDCVMQLTYTVTGTVDDEEVSYTTECTQTNFQRVCCCITEKLSEMSTCADPEGLFKQYMNLKGANANANCGKPKKALELLSAIEKYCADNPCQTC